MQLKLAPPQPFWHHAAMTNSVSNTKKPASAWIEYGPVIAYVIIFNLARRMIDKTTPFNLLGMSVPGEDAPLYIGALVFSIAALFAIIYSKVKTGRVSILLWVTTIIIMGTAAITIGFKNPVVFKMKPTAMNALFGSAILISLAMGKNVFKAMMGGTYSLPDKVWRTLAFRWGVFFFALAALNEYIWRNYSTDFWSNFKLMGMTPITIVFTLLNVPLMMKHMTPLDAQNKEE